MCYISSKNLIDMKTCSINRYDFRNFTKGVITEAKHSRSIEN